MPSIYIIASSLAAGTGIGLILWFMGRRRASEKISFLDNKLKLAENRSLDLQRQMTAIKSEAETLRRNLEEERFAKDAAVSNWQQSVKKGVTVAAFCLVGGMATGAVTGWVGSSMTYRMKQNQSLMELEMNERIALLKAEILEKEMARLTENYEALEKSWHEIAVEKAVAETKLEILLKNIVIEKGGQGFLLDYGQMKNDWQKENADKKLKKDWQTPESQVILNSRGALKPIGT
ncbi:MAG TPA: hypothetical protein VD913_03700 [bacterium]|nr:hypothetical protein [bacterium]